MSVFSLRMHPISMFLLYEQPKTVQLDSQSVLIEEQSLPHQPLLGDALKQQEYLPTIYLLMTHYKTYTSLHVY